MMFLIRFFIKLSLVISSGFGIPIIAKTVGVILDKPPLIYNFPLLVIINCDTRHGIVRMLIFGFPVFGLLISSQLPWSAVIKVEHLPQDLTNHFPKNRIKFIHRLMIASLTAVWPTISPLAKFTTISLYSSFLIVLLLPPTSLLSFLALNHKLQRLAKELTLFLQDKGLSSSIDKISHEDISVSAQ